MGSLYSCTKKTNFLPAHPSRKRTKKKNRNSVLLPLLLLVLPSRCKRAREEVEKSCGNKITGWSEAQLASSWLSLYLYYVCVRHKWLIKDSTTTTTWMKKREREKRRKSYVGEREREREYVRRGGPSMPLVVIHHWEAEIMYSTLDGKGRREMEERLFFNWRRSVSMRLTRIRARDLSSPRSIDSLLPLCLSPLRPSVRRSLSSRFSSRSTLPHDSSFWRPVQELFSRLLTFSIAAISIDISLRNDGMTEFTSLNFSSWYTQREMAWLRISVILFLYVSLSVFYRWS